jgi:hypothetical protein
VLDFIYPVLHDATDENIAWKQGFHHPHRSTPGHFFHPDSGEKNWQRQVSSEVRRRNMFMLRLCPGTVPSWLLVLHGQVFPVLNRTFHSTLKNAS